MKKDDLILVAYVNVSGIDGADVPEYLDNCGKMLSAGNDGSISFYVIPIWHGENRLDCINPKLVSEEEYEKTRNACKEIQDIFNSMNNENKKG